MMTRNEFTDIVNKFNQDKELNNWIELYSIAGNCGWKVFKTKINNLPTYYTFSTVKEFKYWLIHSTEKDFITKRFCPICGKFITTVIRKPYPYTQACCKEHSDILRYKRGQNSLAKHYGVTVPIKSEIIKQRIQNTWKNKTVSEKQSIQCKRQNTCLKKYHDKNFNNRGKATTTCLKKYGVSHSVLATRVKDKRIQTNKLKFGGVSPFCDEKIQAKIRNTNLEKYGEEYILRIRNKHDLAIKTMKEKYGGIGFQSKTISKKIKATNVQRYATESPCQNIIIRKKINKTNLKRYDAEYPLCSPTIHAKTVETCKNNNIYPERNKKAYLTKLRNNSFNSSLAEQEILNILKQHFPDVKYQYISKVYPFRCDFYLPSLDLYIEYQGTWTHNDHPFNPENELDQKRVSFLKEKSQTSSYYKIALKVWTISDPLKRKVAKENHLNWIEFFTLKDFYMWLENF